MKHPANYPRMISLMPIVGMLIVAVTFAMMDFLLAVSQPVTIPIASIKGDIAMDAANQILESVPGTIVPPFSSLSSFYDI